ncbi:hypothetical protein [Streptomyces sp. 150FB]|nr:hypothetical protein [Streptomyces sp. 150FB]
MDTGLDPDAVFESVDRVTTAEPLLRARPGTESASGAGAPV